MYCIYTIIKILEFLVYIVQKFSIADSTFTPLVLARRDTLLHVFSLHNKNKYFKLYYSKWTFL